MSDHTPAMPLIDPAAMRRAMRRASEALRETLDNMARRRQAALAARTPEDIDRKSALSLKYRIRTEREQGHIAVLALAAKAHHELGLLPDCKMFAATFYQFDTPGEEVPVTWCGQHHSRADHPRWCRVALGFNEDGSI